MNNREIIEIVYKIVSPYYKFSLDLQEGRLGSIYVNIDALTIIFFKLIKNGISKNIEEDIILKLKELNIGVVDTLKVDSIGKFISIDLNESENEYLLK